MKKILVALPLFFSCIGNAQQITFKKHYPKWGSTFNSVSQTPDGGYILAGTSGYLSAPMMDLFVVKTDIYGDTIWTASIDGYNYEDQGMDVIGTADGGYAVIGEVSVPSSFPWGFLARTSSSGVIQWTKSFGGSNTHETTFYIIQTQDGGYLVTGTQLWVVDGCITVWKTDATGGLLWTKEYGVSSCSIAGLRGDIHITASTDGGFVIGSGMAVGVLPYTNVYLLKADSNGDTLWTKTLKLDSVSYTRSIHQTADGGYVLSAFGGNSLILGFAYIIRTNSGGDTLWTKKIAAIDSAGLHFMSPTADGGYVLSTQINDIGHLHRLSSAGALMWTRTYLNAGGMGSWGRTVIQTSDGGFATITTDTLNGVATACLMKFDSLGMGSWITVDADGMENTDYTNKVLPNPSAGIFKLQSSQKILSIEIMNLLGEKVSNETNTQHLTSYPIDLRDQPKGIYFYKILLEGGKTATGKIIIQ